MELSRTDIHKGAIALEQVAACFHELATTADAVVLAQRKLSRALKECANFKGCPDFAKSAFVSSSWIIDASTEADARYARVVEKEYEELSSDLRKWFKKLAKDEREIEEYVGNREAKIRQAGESYEKRAMRKDIAESYSRYAEVLNELGAEISVAQEKYTAESNQRHGTVMLSSGAGLARLAGAIWSRHSEGLRRCAPGVGTVIEARTWCESGWRGGLPEELQDLPTSFADESYGVEPQRFPSQEEQYEQPPETRPNGRSSSRPPAEREGSRSRRPSLQPDSGTDPNFRLPSYRSNTESTTSASDRYHGGRSQNTSSATPASHSRLSEPQDTSQVTTDRNASVGTEEVYSDYYLDESREGTSGQAHSLQDSIAEALSKSNTGEAPQEEAPQPTAQDLRASPEPLAAPAARPIPRSRVNSNASRSGLDSSGLKPVPLPTPPRSRDLDYRYPASSSYNPQARAISNPSPTRPSRSPGVQSARLPSPNHSPRAGRALPVTPVGGYGRPISPLSPARFGAPPTNLGLKPPKMKTSNDSWVGKGLRRLSMPSFNGNDR